MPEWKVEEMPKTMIRNDPKLKREDNRERAIKRKFELINLLGGAKCVKCGFSDIRALQFDHIKGEGYKDRTIRNLIGTRLVCYYLNHPKEAKDELQILCANCNWIKRSVNGETRHKQTK